MLEMLYCASKEEIDEVSRHFTIHNCTLMQLLMEKGIVTEDEWDAMTARMTAHVDQAWQKRKDEKKAEFEKENPGIAFLNQLMSKSLDLKGM